MLVCLTSPRSTEVSVDDDTHVLEVIVDDAAPLSIDSRSTELRNIWRSCGDASWNRASGKEPRLDIVGSPLCSINPTANAIQRVAVVIWSQTVVELRTTTIPTIVGLAVCIGEHGSLAAAGNGTSCSCMQSDAVLCNGVDALDDVNLAIGGPIRPKQPVGRPRPTAERHVGQIKDEQAMGVGVIAD